MVTEGAAICHYLAVAERSDLAPCTLLEANRAGGEEARRAFEALMSMTKIDVAAIDAARMEA